MWWTLQFILDTCQKEIQTMNKCVKLYFLIVLKKNINIPYKV